MGRPAKEATAPSRVSLGLKVTAATKNAVDKLARQSGRTQSQEAERLIEIGLRVDHRQRLLTIVSAQAEDDGLWFRAETAPEAYLQQELRKLHAMIEDG